MSYPIIFETKIVKITDNRILHLSLSGCSRDNSGRTRGEFKIKSQQSSIEAMLISGKNPSDRSNADKKRNIT